MALQNLAICMSTAFLFAGCGRGNAVSHTSAPETMSPEPPHSRLAETHVVMHNVDYHAGEFAVLHITDLKGRLIPTRKGEPSVFDDKDSFILVIDAAEIAISTAELTKLMNGYVFGGPDAPLKNLEITIEDGQIKQKGVLRKGIGIPFEMKGGIEATPDGKIRIHAEKIKSAHIPIKGLMKFFGVKMASLINTRNSRGVRVEENDIYLDPARILPPPRIEGRLSAVRIRGDQLVETFGKGETQPDRGKRNFMAYRGGSLRFGKLTMSDADLELIDENPEDPFDFYLDHYKEQLIAGYSKTTPSLGLIVHMPDHRHIVHSRR